MGVLISESEYWRTWSRKDLDLYPNINSLELLTAFLGLQVFGRAWKNCQVLLRMENKSAVAYVNKFEHFGYSNLGLVISKWAVDHGRICSWKGDCHCQLRVEELHRLERLETSTGLVSCLDGIPLKLHSRPFCNSQQPPITSVLELEA